MIVLETFYSKVLENAVAFDKYFKHINTINNYYKEKNEAKCSDYRRINVKTLEVILIEK